jgi:LmbE family N-acetylglucosaminyl deacetylase
MMASVGPAEGDAPARAGGLVGLFAHPDDEAFGMAGTLARAVASGRHVALVCATRGEAGEIADPALATPETLGRVREGELRAAAAAVGAHDVAFLDYVDGHLAEADPEEAVGRIVQQVRRLRPAVLVTFAANGVYGHPDHMAIHRLALAAVEAAADPARYPEQLAGGGEPHRVAKVYFVAPARERMAAMREQMLARGEDFVPGGDAATIPFEQMATPETEITTRISLTDAELDAKRRAMAAHATQMPPGNPFNMSDREQLRAVMGLETFQLVPPPISAREFPTPEDDLFAGLG